MPQDLAIINPFEGQRSPVEAVSRSVQARESAEVLALLYGARNAPRDPVRACDNITKAFQRAGLAELAQYQYARGGTDIVGPSIRAAEAIRICWGNLSAGWREISRTVGADGVGMSEVEAFAIDYETTTREGITFWVRHWRDTKRGGYALKDERDVYELCANQASRRKRACILALVPGDVIEMAMEQAAVTLKAKADTSPEGIEKMLRAFAAFGVTRAQVEKRIQRRLDTIQPAQVVALKRIYASLRDEMSTAADWFEADTAAPPPPSSSAAKVGELLKGGAPPPDDPPELTPEASQAAYDRLLRRVLAAASRDDAEQVLDEARGLLTQADRTALDAAFLTHWQPENPA